MAIQPVRHFIDIPDLTPYEIKRIYKKALEFKAMDRTPKGRNAKSKLLAHKRAWIAFFQESTRTETTFNVACASLGMLTVLSRDIRNVSSMLKGEGDDETAEVIAQILSDLHIVRHDELGGVSRMALASGVATINAGDGPGQHPTQALLDGLTFKVHARKGKRTLLFCGDLRYGRTVHSNVDLLAHCIDTKLFKIDRVLFVAPKPLQIQQEYVDRLEQVGIQTKRHCGLTPELIAEADIVYLTRLQSNLHDDKLSSEARTFVKNNWLNFVLSDELARFLKPDAIVTHPLPAGPEFPRSVRMLPQAVHLKAVNLGLYVREALIVFLLAPELYKLKHAA